MTPAPAAGPWPDPARLGYPSEPEISRAHEMENQGKRFPAWWLANEAVWILRGGGNLRPEGMASALYHGPCLTPSEVATTARVHETAGAEVRLRAAARKTLAAMAVSGFHTAIMHDAKLELCAALALPAADALSAVIAEAVAKEREACAKLCADLRNPDYSAESADWLLGTYACAAAIRARAGETTDAGAAIGEGGGA
jgi:hypothetical protein